MAARRIATALTAAALTTLVTAGCGGATTPDEGSTSTGPTHTPTSGPRSPEPTTSRATLPRYTQHTLPGPSSTPTTPPPR